MNTCEPKWKSNIQDIFDKYKSKNDNVYKIKIYCSLPNKMFEMGDVYVLEHFGKINNKQHIILTIDKEEDCPECLSSILIN